MWESILTQFILLWAVVDPIGSIPVFLVKTQTLEKSRRIGVAFRAILVSVGVLLFFIIVGQVLLEAMEIPLPSFQVAGGIVLFIFALTMIFGESKPDKEIEMTEEDITGVAVYPIAIPSIASPGAMMAVVMLTDNNRYAIKEQAITTGILLAVLLFTFLLLLLAGRIQKFVGKTGAAIVSRVSGLLLASLAVNQVLEGIRSFFQIG